MAPVEHPHARVVRHLMEAFTRQDGPAIAALLSPDCVWRVPGEGGLAGVYDGREAVFGLFRTLKRLFSGPAQFDVVDVAVSDSRVCVVQHATVTADGRELRMKECLVYRVVDDLVVEVDEYQADQAAFDAAFSHAAVAAAQAR
jgi:ketosteroid isomerase-like protein